MWECDVKFDVGNNNMVAEMINNWADVALNGGDLIAPGYEGINSLSLSNMHCRAFTAHKHLWLEVKDHGAWVLRPAAAPRTNRVSASLPSF